MSWERGDRVIGTFMGGCIIINELRATDSYKFDSIELEEPVYGSSRLEVMQKGKDALIKIYEARLKMWKATELVMDGE